MTLLEELRPTIGKARVGDQRLEGEDYIKSQRRKEKVLLLNASVIGN
jgi:hypothetical protein